MRRGRCTRDQPRHRFAIVLRTSEGSGVDPTRSPMRLATDSLRTVVGVGTAGSILLGLYNRALAPVFGPLLAAVVMLPLTIAAALCLDRLGFYGVRRRRRRTQMSGRRKTSPL